MASKDTDKPPGEAADPIAVPDPDEDDLDDMLEEFAASKVDDSKPTATLPAVAPDASGPGRPLASTTLAVENESNTTATATATATTATATNTTSPDAYEDAFSKEFQEGMAQMIQELDSNPDMAKQFEEMLAQMGMQGPPPTSGPAAAPKSVPNAAATASTAAPAAAAVGPAASTSTKPQEDAFQDTIRRTMDRMKASSNSADAAANAEPSPFDDDMMASLLRELQSGSGDDGDESFSKMLLGMMEQLTNKDILYDPMKELDSKFPAWLAEKGDSLPKEDRERYETQRLLVGEIVQRFERDGYKDENPDDREFIVQRMQKMQEAGAPPPDLVGDVDAANELVSGLDQGCAQQ